MTNVNDIIKKLPENRRKKIKDRAEQLRESICGVCEYPMMGGLCGATAIVRGKTTGNPYCHDHGSLIKRWDIEELIPI